jgi:putative hemolysin
MEDLLEEIVGPIFDEYDPAEASSRPTEPGTIPGDLDLVEASKRYGLDIRDEDYQTVGGWVFGRLGRLPHKGDRVKVKPGHLEVIEMKGRRIDRLRLITGTDGKTREEGRGKREE